MIFPRTTVVGSNSAGQTSHPMSHNYSRSMNEQQTCGNSNRMHFRVTARNVTSSKEKSRQNPFVHVELNTADPEKAKRVFGYRLTVWGGQGCDIRVVTQLLLDVAA